jgi:hypothetical protein
MWISAAPLIRWCRCYGSSTLNDTGEYSTPPTNLSTVIAVRMPPWPPRPVHRSGGCSSQMERLRMSDPRTDQAASQPFSGERSQRLWRLRKLHHSVDAELVSGADGDSVELQYLYDGEKAYRRRWPTRALAVGEAAHKRAELERDGWVFHW